MHLPPVVFAYGDMTRAARVTHDDIRRMDPGFARLYELTVGSMVA